jgi:hypothetical protein
MWGNGNCHGGHNLLLVLCKEFFVVVTLCPENRSALLSIGCHVYGVYWVDRRMKKYGTVKIRHILHIPLRDHITVDANSLLPLLSGQDYIKS